MLDTCWKDLVTQTQRSVIEVQELDDEGRITGRRRFETTQRWVQKNELELMLARAGFARWTIAGGFAGEPLSGDSIQLVVEAMKEDPA